MDSEPGGMSTLTGKPEVSLANGRKLADGADIDADDDTGKSIPLAPKSMFMAPKSVSMGQTSVVDPTGLSMASAEQVIILQSDGGCAVERSRECCPDGVAEAVWDIRGNEGRNTLKCRAADPVFPFLGSHYPRHCFIDVDREVFDFHG